MMGRYYDHYSEIPAGHWPWRHFRPAEIACRGDGAILVQDEAMHRLEALRERLGQPLVVASGYRSPWYNRKVGGAERSQHMAGKAFDISLRDGLTIEDLVGAAKAVGFTGIGRYRTFVHVDVGPAREWVG
jgi:uncharacterized protein YcbK (DUF882 family)